MPLEANRVKSIVFRASLTLRVVPIRDLSTVSGPEEELAVFKQVLDEDLPHTRSAP